VILRTVLFVSLLALPAAARQGGHAHPQQPAPQAEAGHHAFLEMERQAIERGEGMGMAMAADKNGYPGPKHVLELKEQLRLTPEQEAEMNRLMAAMKQKAVAAGKELLAAEAELEAMFAAGREEAALRAQVERIAALRAKVRWVHLETHLAARKALTAEQNRMYTHIRYPPQRAGHGH
jgi:Spy/CpxP family protein refolding chaperone